MAVYPGGMELRSLARPYIRNYKVVINFSLLTLFIFVESKKIRLPLVDRVHSNLGGSLQQKIALLDLEILFKGISFIFQDLTQFLFSSSH